MKRIQKLKLNRQTIRQLGAATLTAAHGGVDQNPNSTIPLQCAQTSVGPGCSVYYCVDTNHCTTQWSVTCP